MKVLRASDYKRMPWKNGGGETVEITVFPPNASVSDFDWRISMATVASDGPFSIFPGIDRTLSILDGNGMLLAIDGAASVLLTQHSQPLSFAADVAVDATLPEGTITDLNVMTRRESFTHQVERASGSFSVSKQSDTETIIVLATGSVPMKSSQDSVVLEALDAVWIDDTIAIEARNIVCYVIRVNPL